jgi:hypothetical protein
MNSPSSDDTESSRHFAAVPAPQPVAAPVSKLGGQPFWLDVPEWPLSRDLGVPMWFIGKFTVADDGIFRTRLDVARVPEWLYRHQRTTDEHDFADTAEGHRRKLAD